MKSSGKCHDFFLVCASLTIRKYENNSTNDKDWAQSVFSETWDIKKITLSKPIYSRRENYNCHEFAVECSVMKGQCGGVQG